MRKNCQKLGFVIKTSDSRKSHRAKRQNRISVPENAGRLISVSHYQHRAGVHPSPIRFDHRLQCIELLTGGRGWVEIDGKWSEVGPGDLLWHVAGDTTIGRSDFADPYRCLAVRFSPGPDAPRPVPHHTRWEELDEVMQFTNQVVGLHADDAFDSRVLLRYILSRVHFQAELYLRVQRERGLPAELRQVLEAVNLRFAEPLRVADLAGAAGWSVPHLHDQFKARLGLSPHQALIRRRIQVARELLASTNDPIKSVAGRCGFPNASAFCVQFRKTTQISPTDYRERQLFGRRQMGRS
jgi:AraC-like DNA-binding protein